MMKRLDLGCGNFRKDGCLGVDIAAGPKVDIVHDLSVSIPAFDNECDYIYTAHFLEHLDNPRALLDEIYRVCCNGAHVQINIPLNCIYILGKGPELAHRTIFDYDWLHKYIDPVKFKIINYVVENRHIAAENTSTRTAFSYFEARLFCEVKK